MLAGCLPLLPILIATTHSSRLMASIWHLLTSGPVEPVVSARPFASLPSSLARPPVHVINSHQAITFIPDRQPPPSTPCLALHATTIREPVASMQDSITSLDACPQPSRTHTPPQPSHASLTRYPSRPTYAASARSPIASVVTRSPAPQPRNILFPLVSLSRCSPCCTLYVKLACILQSSPLGRRNSRLIATPPLRHPLISRPASQFSHAIGQ